MLRALKRVVRQLGGRPFSNRAYEAQFASAYRLAGVRTGFMFSWMAAMSFAVFSLVEYFVYSRPLNDNIQIYRAGLIVLFFLLGWHAKVKTQQYEKIFEAVVFGLMVVYSTSILFFEYHTQIAGHSEFFYLSVDSMCILLTINCYCFLRVSVPVAMALAAYFAAATFWTIYMSPVFDSMVAGRMMTYIGVANVAGLLIRQLFDARERRIFLQNKRLKNVAALRQRLIDAEAAANQAKTNFLAMLSHEIRTPMNTIVRLMDLVQHDLGQTLTDKRRATFHQVGQACDQLLSTFDDMLEFAQLGHAVKHEIRSPERFRLADVIRECCETLQHKAAEKNLTLSVDVDNLPEVGVWGEPHRLRRVMLNLVSNAIKFTQQGRVQVRAYEIGQTETKTTVRVAVADSGIGIPAVHRERIFQPFYQADSSYSRKFGGSGLGLAICKQIIASMGGSIEVTSEPGIGSEFTVEIELRKADTAAT